MAKSPIGQGSSDEELMRELCADNAFAFEVLYERYKTPIIAFSRRMLSDKQKAEDVTQEVFLRIIKKKSTYDHSKKFSSWLYRIAANTCIDEMRRFKFFGSNEDKRYENAGVRSSASPHKETEQNEIETLVKAALDKLPKDQKALVILHKYQDQTYEQIAEIMGMDFNKVKWQLKTAYETLEKELKPFFK